MKPAIALVAVLFPAAALADDFAGSPRCLDPEDVVGYRGCPVLGDWGEPLRGPYVFVEGALLTRHFPAAAAASFAARTVMPVASPSGQDVTSFDERVGVGLPAGLYVALDLELSMMDLPPPAVSEPLFLALASAGFQHRLGPVTPGVELAGGVLASSAKGSTGFDDHAVLEARVRLDAWITPRFTIGGVAGNSLLVRGEWMAGVALGFHTHRFGRR